MGIKYEPNKGDVIISLFGMDSFYSANDDGTVKWRDGHTTTPDPQLGEQLDMLFHDMTAGKGDKTGEWYKAVAKVKTDNPKPTE